MHPVELLERYWNHTSFRPLQEEIITSVIEKNDVFVLLPTGGGKSLCFQIPALIHEGICIVISPLIALMKDQVNTLKQKGIKSIALTSGISYAELDTLLDNCIYGNYKFLYLSPERLQQPIVQERIQQMNVSLIAVDEAHCISQWGNDFRPAYAQIGQLRQWHPHVNVIALTATAKTEVIEDTIQALDLLDPKLFKGSFYRANVCFSVIKTNDKLFHLEQLLNKHKGSSIIYVRNRKGTEELQNYLSGKGFSAAAYHGGITNKDKQDRLNDWLNERVSIMVATTAFGMGIDKANVSSVIHYHLPESLESYYQEAGRAGRNGADAQAVILTKKTDEDQLKQQFLGSLPSVADIKLIYNKLCNYFQISYGEGHQTVHQFNFKDFCKTYKLPATKTYNALLVLDRNSIISLNQRFSYRTSIQFICSNEEVFKYTEKHPNAEPAIKSLLRTYGGIFDFETKVNLELVAS
ncbi:MAG: RecQ family ATP-dependent DNA helicase, partial [Winogradskyella sp.]|nr:RecQ family ATP-dependent DNA helicase [Winogradskyella sp.]